MNVNGLLTKCWLSHLESNQNSGYQKPVCSRYTMGQAESRILYHISFAHRPVRMQLMRCGFLMLICITSCGLLRRNGASSGTGQTAHAFVSRFVEKCGSSRACHQQHANRPFTTAPRELACSRTSMGGGGAWTAPCPESETRVSSIENGDIVA